MYRSHHNPFQQHETESQSHKAHYQGNGTQPCLLARPHSTRATAERARGSGRCLFSPWLLQRHGCQSARTGALTHPAGGFGLFNMYGRSNRWPSDTRTRTRKGMWCRRKAGHLKPVHTHNGSTIYCIYMHICNTHTHTHTQADTITHSHVATTN